MKGRARRFSSVTSMTLGACLLVCAASDVSQSQEVRTVSQTLASAGTQTGGDEEVLGYLIRPGDVVKISVWKEPDLSMQATVRFDGKISMPLAGDVDASDRTPKQLAAELQRELSRFVEVPQVSVLVTEVNSARYFVIGRVTNQGAFPYTGPLTIVQALALAGGFEDFAKRDKIFVIREAAGKQTTLTVDYEKLVAERDLKYNIKVLPGDTIVVP